MKKTVLALVSIALLGGVAAAASADNDKSSDPWTPVKDEYQGPMDTHMSAPQAHPMDAPAAKSPTTPWKDERERPDTIQQQEDRDLFYN